MRAPESLRSAVHSVLRYRAVLLLLLVELVIGSVWIARLAISARDHLTTAQAILSGANPVDGNTQAFASDVTRARQQIQAARSDVGDPIWRLAASLPVVGRPLSVSGSLVHSADRVSAGPLRTLADTATSVTPDRLRPRPDTVQLQPLVTAAPALARAADAVTDERAVTQDLPHVWLKSVDRGRQQYADLLKRLADATHTAEVVAKIGPGMLGANGPRRYFVAVQQPAEARGTGGLVGGYVIVVADHGRLTIERRGSDADLPPVDGVHAEGLPAEYVTRYSRQGATHLWSESNVAPHFPYAMQLWSNFWTSSTGQRLDGAVALDATVLSQLLKATGPVPGPPAFGLVTADNVEEFLGSRQYALTQNQSRRKDLLQDVASEVLDRVVGGGRTPTAPLLKAFVGAANTGHLLLGSLHPDEQLALAPTEVSGALPDTPEPLAWSVVTNNDGSKLGYYLDESVAYRVDRCAGESRGSTMTVTLTNNAPRRGLPPYVTVRADHPDPSVPAGQMRPGLSMLLTRGAVVRSARLDSQDINLLQVGGPLPKVFPPTSLPPLLETTQRGHPELFIEFELPPGQSRTVTVTYDEPNSSTPPSLYRQPLVHAPELVADLRACGNSA